MKKVVIVVTVLFLSCRTSMTIQPDQDLIDFLIEEYRLTNEAYVNKYNYFIVSYKVANEKCLELYRVSPSLNNFYTPTVKENLFDFYPTNYKVVKGKTFFWRNPQDTIPSMEIFTYLNSQNLIDSSYIEYELGKIDADSIKLQTIIKDDGIEIVNYIICRNNPNKVNRKIKTPAYYSSNMLLKRVNCKCN